MNTIMHTVNTAAGGRKTKYQLYYLGDNYNIYIIYMHIYYNDLLMDENSRIQYIIGLVSNDI